MSKALLVVRDPWWARLFLAVGGFFGLAIFAAPTFFEPDRSIGERVFFGLFGFAFLLYLYRHLRFDRILFFEDRIVLGSPFRVRTFQRSDILGFFDAGAGYMAGRRIGIRLRDGSSEDVGLQRFVSKPNNFGFFLDRCERWLENPTTVGEAAP